MEMKVITSPIAKTEIEEIAGRQFGDFVKAVVDTEKKIMAIGGELHADMEALLMAQGSEQKNLWGVNLYPARPENELIEFNSMINVRPSQGNRSRNVEDQDIRMNIKAIADILIR
ncbi:MAG: DUF5674 family protein [Patescibacteria group bacterium]